MATIRGFGSYLPEQVVTNRELAADLGVTEEWIVSSCGIRERRRAGDGETVDVLAVRAAEDCLARCGVSAGEIGMAIVSSGSSEQRFPGPAAAVAHALGMAGVPALDLPVASAGSLFGLALASRVVTEGMKILVIAAERMTAVTMRQPLDKNTSILFGDGAGACLVESGGMGLRVVDSVLHSDGAYAADLRLGLDGGMEMNGRSVIVQAGRKMPGAITEVLERNGVKAADVRVFVTHQANQNLIDRAARALEVPEDRFFSNIATRGNTSSASMLIAAAECFGGGQLPEGAWVCFAAFGAGFHWGAVLMRSSGRV